MEAKYRIILVNCDIPAASFYTVQFADFSVAPYEAHKQEQYAALVKQFNVKLTPDNTGDAYSEWITKNNQ